MRNRILIAGYMGFGNAGYEAIAHAMTEQLREAVAGAEITIVSGDPAHTAAVRMTSSGQPGIHSATQQSQRGRATQSSSLLLDSAQPARLLRPDSRFLVQRGLPSP